MFVRWCMNTVGFCSFCSNLLVWPGVLVVFCCSWWQKTDPTANWSKYLWCILIKQKTCQNDIVLPIIFWHHEIPPISSISSSPVCLVSLCVCFIVLLIHGNFSGFRWISVDSVDCPWALHVHIPQQLLDEFVGLTLLILRDVRGILRFAIQFKAYLLTTVWFRWWMDQDQSRR